MDEFKFIQNCQLCGSSFQMGPHRYDGKRIPKYNLNVCNNCYQASWDGWNQTHEEIILKHLEELGIPEPLRNDEGRLPRD